jgi:alpha-ketoglutarate-dependent taurine dioxygenase
MNSSEGSAATLKQSWAERRKNFQPKGITLSEEGLVRAEPLEARGGLPLVIRPGFEGVSLIDWARNHRDFIREKLLQHGGLLFRGFDVHDHEDFDAFLEAIALERMNYMEGATPRVELGDKIYTSTEYPPEESIALHNELNYVITWPMKIFFFCETAAERGGETPVADVRRVYEFVPARVRERFEQHGWLLVRNFTENMSLPWQTSFRLNQRSELEDYCRRSRIEWQWLGGNNLRTRQVRPAVRHHPVTGEKLWFNHVAFWHVSSLDRQVREMFLKEFDLAELPYNTYYGDGEPIADEDVEAIREAYRRATVAFLWEHGDLLMLDNMLVAHGRSPFAGRRKILTAMGDPSSGVEKF